jgi:hypothetical protein
MIVNSKSHFPPGHARIATRRHAEKSRVGNRPKRELLICLGWLKLFDVIVAGR